MGLEDCVMGILPHRRQEPWRWWGTYGKYRQLGCWSGLQRLRGLPARLEGWLISRSSPMFQRLTIVALSLGLWPFAIQSMAEPADVTKETIVEVLNSHDTVRASDSSKAWTSLFDAYLELSKPPMTVGKRFNLGTIWPGMSDWDKVSSWAAANPAMSRAIIDSSKKSIIGLPYGKEQVPATYAGMGIYIDVNIDSEQRTLSFSYFEVLDTIQAYVAAESYRRFEAGDVAGAIELMNANTIVLRMFCDRQFLKEKVFAIRLLDDALGNMRDTFWTYLDKITMEQFQDIALRELPYLRPDRSRLLIPEGDRFMAEALLNEVFDQNTGDAKEEEFARVFTRIQSEEEPLTRLGAASRWREIAKRHGGLEGSQERLTLIFDDWWRRWRIREYNQLLSIGSEFDKANAMRYAGVLISIENIQELFSVRNNLRVAVYGTAVSAAICAFKKDTGVYPASIDNRVSGLYGGYVSRRIDKDPYNYRKDLKGLDSFRYRLLKERTSLDVGTTRVWLPKGTGLLYSIGSDQEDGLGSEHAVDDSTADIIIWPPTKALVREETSRN